MTFRQCANTNKRDASSRKASRLKCSISFSLSLVDFSHQLTDASVHCFQQIHQIVGVLFFHRQDVFQHAPRRRIIIPEVINHLAIAVDGDAFGNEVFLIMSISVVPSTYSATAHEQAAR